uniref:Uncharacterized protein n=1 Tax=Arundo donax TaxID=35708 RepID=A0A0A8Z9L3_ARUDO
MNVIKQNSGILMYQYYTAGQ